jgi:hypothetical protein
VSDEVRHKLSGHIEERLERVEEKISHVSERVSSIERAVSILINDLTDIRHALWYVVASAILGPIIAVFVSRIGH